MYHRGSIWRKHFPLRKLCCQCICSNVSFCAPDDLPLSSKLQPGSMVPAQAWVLDGSWSVGPCGMRPVAPRPALDLSVATCKLSVAARRRLWLTPESLVPCNGLYLDRCTPMVQHIRVPSKLMAQTNASARQARRRLELPKEGTAAGLATSLARWALFNPLPATKNVGWRDSFCCDLLCFSFLSFSRAKQTLSTGRGPHQMSRLFNNARPRLPRTSSASSSFGRIPHRRAMLDPSREAGPVARKPFRYPYSV